MELLYIPLNKIRQNKVALRENNREDPQFIDLVNSIRQEGVLSPISVVRKSDPNDDKEFELVDGLQRFMASTTVGTGSVDKVPDPDRPGRTIAKGKFKEIPALGDAPAREMGVIPAQVIERNEADILAAQMIANAQRVETKPSEYANQIVRFLGHNPTMTESELAVRLGKTPAWLGKMMRLNRLAPTIKSLVDDGSIPLINAFSLANLPSEEQTAWLERAQTMKSEEFVPAASKRAKEIRDAHRKGENAQPEQFQPVRHFRKKPEIESEADKPTLIPALIRDLEITKEFKPTPQGLLQAAQAGAVLALNWALNYDPKAQDAQREKDRQRKEQQRVEKEKRDAEKKAKQEAEAGQKAAGARETAAAAREVAAAT